MTSGPPGDAPGHLTIDLDALAANWRTLAALAAPAECAAVVKANAYGTGLDRAAPALFAAGARTFFVAHLSEALAARRLLPEAEIYVLNGLEAGADPADYAAFRLKPALGSEEEVARWAAFAAGRDAPAPAALHLDTGMRRLGFGSLAALAAAVETHGAQWADLLMSHFVSSEIEGDPLNAGQIAGFEAARAAFPKLRCSLANSSGIFLAHPPTDLVLRSAEGASRRTAERPTEASFETPTALARKDAGGADSPLYDLVRPGYALYGGNPTPGRPNPMRAVVTLTVAVQQTRRAEAGETCGYNAQWMAKRRTRLATLLAGYADGLPRGAGGTDARAGADAMIAGRRCPLVGRVSMDLIIADVTDLPEDAVRPGTRAELFGPNMSLDDFAARSGTIGYNVLTGLGARYRRTYVDPA